MDWLAEIARFAPLSNIVTSVALVIFASLVWRASKKHGSGMLRLEQDRDRQRLREADARRHAVDARISANAYRVALQLKTWLDEPLNPTTSGSAASLLDGVSEAASVTPHRAVEAFRDWASRRSREAGSAVKVFGAMVADAPEASENVAKHVRAAFVRFHEGMSALNRLAGRLYEDDKEAARLAGEAFTQIRDSIRGLEPAVGPELSKAGFVYGTGSVAVNASINIKASGDVAHQELPPGAATRPGTGREANC